MLAASAAACTEPAGPPEALSPDLEVFILIEAILREFPGTHLHVEVQLVVELAFNLLATQPG